MYLKALPVSNNPVRVRYHDDMEPSSFKPIPVIIAVAVLLLAGVGVFYVLTRPVGNPSPTLSGPGAPFTEQTETLSKKGTYYTIQATYPTTTRLVRTAGKSADNAAALILKNFVEQEAARFIDTNITGLKPEDIQVMGLGGERIYTLDIGFDAHEGGNTVSYVFHMYADTLGAHPNAYYRTFTFDAKTGEALTLEDLFVPGTPYLETLSKESRALLKVQMQKVSGEEPDVEMLQDGTTPDADNFQNFYLDGNDLVLMFPPYQAAPYVFGLQEARIPRTELVKTLRAEYR